MQAVRRIFLLIMLFSSFSMFVLIAQEKPASGGLAIDCCFPAQAPVGRDSVVVIISQAVKSISAIKITPPEGIKIKKIEEGRVSDYDKTQGKKRWEITINVDKKAKTGTRNLILETPDGVSQEKQLKVIPYVPEITAVKILSTKKDKWTVNFMLSVNYSGKELSTKSKLNIQMICGTDAIFTIRDVKKAANKGKGKWEVTGMVDNPGFNAYCENPAEISVSLEDDNEYQSDYYTLKFQFK